MENFLNQLKNTLDNSSANVSVTENGAVGYKTSGKALLDLNFAVSSLRSMGDAEIEKKFAAALGENFNLAIVWLFFARDVRGGLGERRLFRVCMRYLCQEFPDTAKKLLSLISEYGRWDDLVLLLDEPAVRNQVILMVAEQLTKDMSALSGDKPVSLLGKWMPSENSSSRKTRALAKSIREALGCSPRDYRVLLSALRRKIDVTERKMSANEWAEIAYPGVPSRANLLYNDAFLRHDEERRRKFLEAVKKGEEKINASVLFPHDIVSKYRHSYSYVVDDTLEALWKALPNTVTEDTGGTIVVADGSGSMSVKVGGTGTSALDVANSLAIYFAERLSGPFKDQYITFSKHPQLVDLRGASTLRKKLDIARSHSEVANTNIEAVFDLILQTAVKNYLKQEELPRSVLIISDMEFDIATIDRYYDGRNWVRGHAPDANLFKQISAGYAAHGYRLPRLVFWNVNSRTGTIPVKENEAGVALVSGFSPNVAKMVMSGKLDPFEALLETLNDRRYDAVCAALS